MTLHKDMEKPSTDELGALIRWSLQERVVDASPSPEVWERILARAERPVVWKRPKFYNGYRVVRAQLAKISVFLEAQIVSWLWPQGRWVEWRFDPRFTRTLFDQYGFFLFRLAF